MENGEKGRAPSLDDVMRAVLPEDMPMHPDHPMQQAAEPEDRSSRLRPGYLAHDVLDRAKADGERSLADRQQAEPAKIVDALSFVQPVPDHCDRIVWRERYYHLPLEAKAEPAPAQDERDFNPEHTLFNEIRCSMPVNDDGEETRYIINEQQLQRIRALEFNRPAQTEQQPIIQVIRDKHAGIVVDWADEAQFPQGVHVELYAAPIAQTASQKGPNWKRRSQQGWQTAAMYRAENQELKAQIAAQTEQQPVAFIDPSDLERFTGAKMQAMTCTIYASGSGLAALHAAPIAQTAPRPTGLSQGWNLVRQCDGFVIGHSSDEPSQCRKEQALADGRIYVPFLVAQTAPQPEQSGLADLPYQTLFNAIAAATDAGDSPVSISVKAFRAALSAQGGEA